MIAVVKIFIGQISPPVTIHPRIAGWPWRPMAWNSRGGAGPWPAAGAIAGLRLGCENKPGHRGQSRRGLTGTLLASRRSKTELADRNLSNTAPQPHPIREQRRIFEPRQQPQNH